MKAQLCRMLAALLCVCTVTGCSANKKMPTGYLTTITKKEHRTTVIEPVWLQPDEGRVTPVCDEEHHGADCPFYGMDESVRSYLTRDDDTIYYVTETAADSGERTLNCSSGWRIDSKTVSASDFLTFYSTLKRCVQRVSAATRSRRRMRCV